MMNTATLVNNHPLLYFVIMIFVVTFGGAAAISVMLTLSICTIVGVEYLEYLKPFANVVVVMWIVITFLTFLEIVLRNKNIR